MAKDPSKKPRDPLAAEVDRLLRKLPGADPTLRGSEPAKASGTGGAVRPVSGPSPGLHVVPVSRARERVLVWIATLLGVVLSVAMTQWPYAHACGLSLFVYLGAVLVVLILGGLGTLGSWRERIPLTHILSLLVVFWGIVLAAEQVLPRIGYARETATWGCVARG